MAISTASLSTIDLRFAALLWAITNHHWKKSDDEQVMSAHAVVFHVHSDLSLRDLPRFRHPNQRYAARPLSGSGEGSRICSYVFFSHESAQMGHDGFSTFDTPVLRGFFNWRGSSQLPALQLDGTRWVEGR